jgi:diadenosine tetraphosphate (Ap4A) HIT family hydrolase
VTHSGPRHGAATPCRSCALLATAAPPPHLRIAATGRWCVAHAFNANLEGWLVVLPLRHVESLDELDLDEAAELGPLLVATTVALREVVGCEKTYVMCFAESEGFHHVHVHVVPRAADLPHEHQGPRIFTLLANPDRPAVDPERMDVLALAVRASLLAQGIAST